MRPLYKGTIVRLHGWKSSSLAFLEVEDMKRGRIHIPCDNGQTVGALHAAFEGFINPDHTFDNGAIAGEVIYYRLDEDLGLILTSFVPVEMAEPELVEEYERRAKAHCTVLGVLPPADRIYRGGPLVSGRRITEFSKKTFH